MVKSHSFDYRLDHCGRPGSINHPDTPSEDARCQFDADGEKILGPATPIPGPRRMFRECLIHPSPRISGRRRKIGRVFCNMGRRSSRRKPHKSILLLGPTRVSPFPHLTNLRYAFSDNAPSPMSGGAAIDVLQAALPKANISTSRKPGWILVSHGVGGLYSEILASRHTNQVKGMLFVDAIPESLIPTIFTSGRTFKLLVRGIISPLGIDRLAGWIFKHRTREDRVRGDLIV